MLDIPLPAPLLDRRQREKQGWLRRQGWWLVLVVPAVGALLLTQWLSYADKPTVVTVEITAPDHIAISETSFRWQSYYSSRISTQQWYSPRTGGRYVQSIGLANSSDREVIVSLSGLDGGGKDFALSYRTPSGLSAPITIPARGAVVIDLVMVPGYDTETGHSRTIRLALVDNAGQTP